MSQIKINVNDVRAENKAFKRLIGRIDDRREELSSLRYRIDGRITSRRNIDSRMSQASLKLNDLHNRMQALYNFIEYGMEAYVQADDKARDHPFEKKKKKSIWGKIGGAINSAVDGVTGFAEDVADAAVSTVKGIGNMVVHPIEVGNGIAYVAGRTWKTSQDIWDKVEETWNIASDWKRDAQQWAIDGIEKGKHAANDFIDKTYIGGVDTHFKAGVLKGLVDTIAGLSEFVVSSDPTDFIVNPSMRALDYAKDTLTSKNPQEKIKHDAISTGEQIKNGFNKMVQDFKDADANQKAEKIGFLFEKIAEIAIPVGEAAALADATRAAEIAKVGRVEAKVEAVGKNAVEGTGNATLGEIRQATEFLKNNGLNAAQRREVIEAFNPGAKVVKLEDDLVVYRYSGGVANPRGRWVTTEQLSDPVNQLALPPGSTAENVTKWVIPKGTEVFQGTVAPNFGRQGGAAQIYIPDPNLLK